MAGRGRRGQRAARRKRRALTPGSGPHSSGRGQAALLAEIGLTDHLADHGITEPDFAAIAAGALAGEVLANAPRQPCAADIESILASAL